MLSINMRIFKTVLLIASFGACVRCLPIDDGSSEPQQTTSQASTVAVPLPTTDAAAAAPISTRADADYYDQRQNGTENYRIHVDGVVLVFAPVEALLLAGAAGAGTTTESSLSLSDALFQLDDGKPNVDKPNANVHNKTEPAISKTVHRPALRLANLLTPFLRRVPFLHHERGTSVH